MKSVLFLAAAALAHTVPAAAQKPTTVVPIQLYSFGYVPNPIVLRAGQTATLSFKNASNIGHTFKAPDFFRSSRILSGMVHEGEIHLKGGESTSVTVIPARGTYRVHCSHFFHDQLGMHTAIYVQ